MITHQLRCAVDAAVAGLSGVSEAVTLPPLRVERPRHAEHGDYAVNVSPLSKTLRKAPPQIAAALASTLTAQGYQTEIAGGFINFHLADSLLLNSLVTLIHVPQPGSNTRCATERILLEFVSANPTGPLHIGHGRWAALGDSIRRIIERSGGRVWSEFYINDAGVQMANITQSLWLRCIERLDPSRTFPQKQGDEPFPYYPGEYVIELAEAFLKQPGHKEAITQASQAYTGTLPPELPLFQTLQTFARETLLAEQQSLLSTLGTHFDQWTSEQTLHQNGQVQATLEALRTRGVTEERDGALWLLSSQFGDEKDRVLVKSDGSLTYLTADIAYHLEKYDRKDTKTGSAEFNRIINIWGADHHGYIARMRAAIQALGYDATQFEVLLGQLVNLIVDGEKTRMGKRKKMLTLEDVINEVGVDATRFWMVSKSADTALDFDVALAQSKTDENPVFYAQYAHARCAGILRNATQERLDTVNQSTLPPLLSPEMLHTFFEQLQPEALQPLFEHLDDPRAKQALRQLIFHLDGFSDLVGDAAALRSPHLVSRYLLDLAAQFHSFYSACRILTPDPAVSKPRLAVVYAVQRVLASGMDLLGVTSPDSM